MNEDRTALNDERRVALLATPKTLAHSLKLSTAASVRLGSAQIFTSWSAHTFQQQAAKLQELAACLVQARQAMALGTTQERRVTKIS